MVHVHGEVVFNRAAEDVFDFVADERNRYDPCTVRAEQISDGPIALGTRFRTETKGLGRPIGMIVGITGYERPGRLASSTHLSSMDIHSTFTFDPVPEGTRMRWSSDLVPRRVFKVMTPLLARVGQRPSQAIWDSLKRVLEADEGNPAEQPDQPSRS